MEAVALCHVVERVVSLVESSKMRISRVQLWWMQMTICCLFFLGTACAANPEPPSPVRPHAATSLGASSVEVDPSGTAPLTVAPSGASSGGAEPQELVPLARYSPEGGSVSTHLNQALERFNSWVATALFFNVTGDLFTVAKVDDQGSPVIGKNGEVEREVVAFPFIVFVLIAGGVYFTAFYRFISVRQFRHAIDVVRGKFDRPDAEGDVSHFRALTSALSATVGLGNIAGVAIAIQVGGPGAVLWMIIAAFFGMSLKFNSCTLAQMFRRKNPDGSVSGGPMFYLDMGLRKLGGDGSALAKLGKALGFVYACMIIGGSFGGGNMFQSNQAISAVRSSLGVSFGASHAMGVLLAVLVALVILGGIQRIGAATARIVPLMVGIYVSASLFILVSNAAQLPQALSLIFQMAFTENALYGGTVGVMIKGFQRASFSNEAGIGSSAVAHAAAKTDQPVCEGLVAMLEPVIDTMIVCLMTAMVVVVTGAWNDPALETASGISGVQLTAAAFGKELPWFSHVLTVCVVLFAYSTMISWAYYGERGWIYLADHVAPGFGQRTLSVYRVVFVLFVYIGAVTQLTHVLNFSDLMILCMAFPNILGSILLAPTVWREVCRYRELRAGRGAPAPPGAGG